MHGLPMMFEIPRLVPPSWAADAGDGEVFMIQYPGVSIRFERALLGGKLVNDVGCVTPDLNVSRVSRNVFWLDDDSDGGYGSGSDDGNDDEEEDASDDNDEQESPASSSDPDYHDTPDSSHSSTGPSSGSEAESSPSNWSDVDEEMYVPGFSDDGSDIDGTNVNSDSDSD